MAVLNNEVIGQVLAGQNISMNEWANTGFNTEDELRIWFTRYLSYASILTSYASYLADPAIIAAVSS